MESFKFDEYGDVTIENGEIELISGSSLLCQKVRQVLSTNLGEYGLGKEQGINFRNILGRNFNEDLVKDEILRGLRQIDDSFTIEDFKCDLRKNRTLKVSFTAKTENNESVEFTKIYA